MKMQNSAFDHFGDLFFSKDQEIFNISIYFGMKKCSCVWNYCLNDGAEIKLT